MIKIYDMETLEEREILFRGGSGADVSAPVAEILRAVQERGDAALRGIPSALTAQRRTPWR